MKTDVPANSEIANEEEGIRRAILAAIQRIILGQPRLIAPGNTSLSGLAIEAGVPRHHLYQTHPDLRARFEFLRDRPDQKTQMELDLDARLRKAKLEIQRLVELQARTHERASTWKALTETLARAINVLQEELRQEQIKSGRLARKVEGQVSTGSIAPLTLIRKPQARD